MDNGLLLVNFDSLSNAGADIDRAVKELQSRLDEVERDGDRLMATWDGKAQQAYLERQKKWQAAAADLTIILNDIKIALNESTDDFQRTERMATNRFQ